MYKSRQGPSKYQHCIPSKIRLIVTMMSLIWFLCTSPFHGGEAMLILPQRQTSSSAGAAAERPWSSTPTSLYVSSSSSSSRAQDNMRDNNDEVNNGRNDHDNTYKNNHHLTNPTSLFNNDIYRIASRTKMASSSSTTTGANFNPIHAAEHAERMLLQMIQMYHSSNRKTARPNIESFQIVLMGYANLKGYRWDSTNENDDNDDGGDNDGNPDGGRRRRTPFGYSSSAYTNLWGDEFMDRIHQQQEEEQYIDNDNNYRERNNINKDLTCAADRVDFVMEQLYKLQQSEIEAGNDISDLELNTNVCNLCLLAYARCSYPQQHYMKNNENDEIMGTNDSGFAHSEENQPKELKQVINPSLAPLTERGSYAERAERLVKYMLYLSKTKSAEGGQKQVEPNCQTYSYLIWSLSRQQLDVRRQQKRNWDNKSNRNIGTMDSHYAIRASEWISHLENLYTNSHIKKETHQGQDVKEVQPEQAFRKQNKRLLRKYLLWAYSDVLSAWCKCSEKKSPKKVYKYITLIEQLCKEDKEELDEMHTIDNQEDQPMMHDNDHGDDLIGNSNTWLGSSPDLGINANEEYEPYLDKNIPLYPSAQCYTQAILSLSKSKELGSAQRANEILYRMLEIYDSGEWGRHKPGVYAFNGVISAWANCASSTLGNADRAEKILNLMEELYFDGDKPEYDHLKPDSISYNTAIKAWATSKEDAAMFRAETLVERMEEKYNAVGDDFLDVKPDSYTYNTMITGWLRSDLGIISTENAEALLRRMVEKFLDGDRDLEPHQKIFSSIIDKWAKSDPSKNIAVKRSIDLLNLMESLYENGCNQLRPDKITYTNIIDAIARSRSPAGAQMALLLLETMETKYQNGDRDVKPSAQTYSCTLLSLLNSNMGNKHIIAQNIPKRMRDLGVEPNAFTWNYIIHVASMVDGNEERKMEAFKVALGAFQTLRKSEDHDTDSFTYTFFLKAINHLMPQSVMRSSIIKETFLECAKEGKVNDQVLSRLVWAVPQEEAREIIGPVRISDIRNIKAHHVPKAWGRKNVYRRK